MSYKYIMNLRIHSNMSGSPAPSRQDKPADHRELSPLWAIRAVATAEGANFDMSLTRTPMPLSGYVPGAGHKVFPLNLSGGFNPQEKERKCA